MDELTLRIRQWGAEKAAREVDRLQRSVVDVRKEIARQAKATDRTRNQFLRALSPSSAVTRALRMMATRAVMATGAIVGLAGGFAVLSPAVAMTVAAMTALGFMLGGLFLVGLGAFARFNDTVNVAGSAANDLAEAWADFRDVFGDVTAAGGDTILSALAQGLRLMLPVLQSLEPAFTALSTAAANMILTFAQAMQHFGPELNQLLMGFVPLMPELARAMVGLTTALVMLGIAGLPVLTEMVGWIADLAWWLRGAIPVVERFLSSQEFLGAVSAAWAYLSGVMEDLIGIATQLWELFEPYVPFLGEALLAALVVVAEAVELINENFEFLANVLGPLLLLIAGFKTALLAVRLAVTAIVVAQRLWNLAVAANPLGAIATALLILIPLIVELTGGWDAWGRKISEVWDWLTHALLDWVKQALYDLTNWLIDRLNDFIDLANMAIPFGDPIEKQGHLGEEESAAAPTPAPPAPALPNLPVLTKRMPRQTFEFESHTALQLDPTPLATSVHRQSIKKKSTR